MPRERALLLLYLFLLLPLALYCLPPSLARPHAAGMWKQSFFTNSRPRVDEIIEGANQYLSDQSVTIVFRQSDFGYYGRSRLIDHNDMRLAPAFQAPTSEAAWDLLRALGVTHLFLPPYHPPTVYNTIIASLLGDPRFTTLLYSVNGYRLYELNEAIRHPARIPLPSEAIQFEPDAWSDIAPREWLNVPLETVLVLTGASARPAAVHATNPIARIESLYRHGATIGTAASEPASSGDADPASISKNRFVVMPGGWYELCLTVQGSGVVSMMVYEYDTTEADYPDRSILLDQAVLTGGRRTLRGQFVSDKKTMRSRIVVELASRGSVAIGDVEMARILESPTQQGSATKP